MGTFAGDTIIAPGAFPAAFAAACNSQMDLANNVEVDVAGATITVVTTKVNAQFLCIGSFYVSMLAASAGIAIGKLHVDGVVQAGFANFTGLSSTPERGNVAQSWIGTLASAGSHTLKLRAVGPGQTGTPLTPAHRINTVSTTITVLVF